MAHFQSISLVMLIPIQTLRTDIMFITQNIKNYFQVYTQVSYFRGVIQDIFQENIQVNFHIYIQDHV